jgi:hypothetical protein
MTIQAVGVLALAIGLFGLFFDASFIVYAFFCATLLGSAAAFVLNSLGGTNISPAHLLLGFLALRLLGDRRVFQKIAEGILPGRAGFWLLVTVVYSALSAFFLPRLFAGQTFVVAVRAVDSFNFPLEPTMANLTQSIYLIADFICFILIYGYARDTSARLIVGNAVVYCVILNLIFAGLDLATYATGTTELLAFIRNANYALLAETELAGSKRIVGSFVEASAFGAATLGYFAFATKLWLLGVRPRLMFTLSSLSLCALIFSTSSTAAVGLAAMLMISYSETLFVGMRRLPTSQMTFFLVGAPIVFAILGCVIALNEESSAYVYNLLDTTVFSKLSSSSGEERSSWNFQAWQVFIDTFGFGAGNGSMRTSSFPLAVIANLGVIGATLFALFFAGIFFGGNNAGAYDSLEGAYRQAAKSACIAWLITATISGSLTDLGMPFFAFAAIAWNDSASAIFVRNRVVRGRRILRSS